MKDRIQEIIKREHLTNADFAKKIDVSPATISSILTGRNNPSLDVVMKIHQTYKDLNLEWLLYGQGEMTSPKGMNSMPTLFDEIAVNASQSPVASEYRRENMPKEPMNTSKGVIDKEVRYIEKPQRKITEIRIFFDDNTYEIFRPEK